MKQLLLHHPVFKEQLQLFTQRKKDEGKSDSYVYGTTNQAKEFLHFLEQKGVDQLSNINQSIIDTYFYYLQTRPNQKKAGGLSPTYLDKHREAVLRFMEFILELDMGSSPFDIPCFTKKCERVPKDILTQQEVQELFINQVPNMNGIRNLAILSLLYGCGLRKSELYRLDVSDINFFSNTVRIKKTKNSRQRDVPLSPNVKIHIENYLFGVREYLLPQSKSESAFLISNRGNRMSLPTIGYKLKEIARTSTSNKPISAHRLRHAIATHLLEHFTIEEIALFLGHKSIDSSQIYLHIAHTKEPEIL